jgi:hypothetical protein
MLKMVVFSVLCAASAMADIDSHPIGAPRSPQAVTAQEKHDAAVKRAHDAYIQAQIIADRQLVDDLDVALATEMKLGPDGLGEATRIQAARAKAVEDLKSADEASNEGVEQDHAPQPLLVLRSARNGIAEKWVDVTDEIKQRAEANSLNGYGSLPGVPGRANTLVIDGTYGGREFELSFSAANLGETLYFGPPR